MRLRNPSFSTPLVLFENQLCMICAESESKQKPIEVISSPFFAPHPIVVTAFAASGPLHLIFISKEEIQGWRAGDRATAGRLTQTKT